MAYGTDFKQRALVYIKRDTAMSRQPKFLMLASELSSLGKKKLREQEHLERKKRVVKKRKIPLEELKAFVEAHPDAFLLEIAGTF